MSFYEDMANTATQLLTEFGQAISITSNVTSSYNTTTGSQSIATITQSGIGAIFDYGSKAIDGTLIKQGDKQLLLSVSGIFEPKIGDIVTALNGTSTITMVKSISPAGTQVMYECNLRGA